MTRRAAVRQLERLYILQDEQRILFWQEIPLAGPKDAAFRHYSGPVGKPTYELKMR